ncbi:unnamed protein product [Camellia sinensis]
MGVIYDEWVPNEQTEKGLTDPGGRIGFDIMGDELGHKCQINDEILSSPTFEILPSEYPPACDIPENYGFEMDDRYSEPGDLDDEDDPWKPLNPYEPRNLMKSFRRQGINSTKWISITIQFPLARMHGTISSKFSDIWEARRHASERQQESQSP